MAGNELPLSLPGVPLRKGVLQPMQLFANAPITGGNFQVTINTVNSPPQKKVRRRNIYDSDSD